MTMTMTSPIGDSRLSRSVHRPTRARGSHRSRSFVRDSRFESSTYTFHRSRRRVTVEWIVRSDQSESSCAATDGTDGTPMYKCTISRLRMKMSRERMYKSKVQHYTYTQAAAVRRRT